MIMTARFQGVGIRPLKGAMFYVRWFSEYREDS